LLQSLLNCLCELICTEKQLILLVMGVTGSGKTTVGEMLAKRLGWVYLEADDFHSPENKDKMHRGVPLTEADRVPWLNAMHAELVKQDAQGKSAVLACSALREEYRARLDAGLPVTLIYLRGPRGLIGGRLRLRKHHFAGESILDDQFAVLEEPGNALVVDIKKEPEAIVEEILQKIR
jgi:gluconokinase